MTNSFANTWLLLTIGFSACMAGCETGRSEGHIEVRLVNLHRDGGAKTLEIRLGGEDGTLRETYFLDSLYRDSVSFPGLKTGTYTVTASSLDAAGRVVQEGLSPTLVVAEGEIVEAPTVMVTLDYDTPCPAGKTTCEILPGFDVVMACGDGNVWRPRENCGDARQCTDGACEPGAPHEKPDAADPEGAVSRELAITVCDPSIPKNRFTTEIANPYFPVVVGSRRVLEGEDDEEENMRVEITVPDEAPVDVDGVATRVVEELESEDGVLRQRTRNYYAQAEDGTVCYFGEEVWQIDDGREQYFEAASWLSDTANRIYPGIVMPAAPVFGMTFQQQVAPGICLDRGEIVGAKDALDTAAGIFDDTLWILETSPLDASGDGALKVYAKDIGLVADEGLALIER